MQVLNKLYLQVITHPKGTLSFLGTIIGFLLLYLLPLDAPRFENALLEGVRLPQWYAREHVILCLLPAFVIAGAMTVYMAQGVVMKYLGPDSPKFQALSVASISGLLLAVCSCTVLPLFGGIYKRGAGLGAATAFLYSGPAINIMAVVITAKVLGLELGIARFVGAIVFAVVIGLLMHLIYHKEEESRAIQGRNAFQDEKLDHPLWAILMFFFLQISFLIFANWAAADNESWMVIHHYKWTISSLLYLSLVALLIIVWKWPKAPLVFLTLLLAILGYYFPSTPELPVGLGVIGLMLINFTIDDQKDWALQTWDFTKQIMPLLVIGVFVAGFLLGRPDHEGLIPSSWVVFAIGDNSLLSTFLASFLGGFMYFSTLTEVPIVQGLIGAGMGKGPALSLLLAGPAISLPNMLVIKSIMGIRKTLVYCSLVIVMSTITGYSYSLIM